MKDFSDINNKDYKRDRSSNGENKYGCISYVFKSFNWFKLFEKKNSDECSIYTMVSKKINNLIFLT
ncbi:hypothetical protein A0H76_2103 [Hepatospora eriocheir]|uniref:Uncharacterized protein n=1 Tax=Hepatospora eriocheir TaxID=1081669 RepID=A0A1X0QFS8_9MICR|nr:hypothetical protein A0H76_2103 [Hepatospora eriocheir]